MDEFTRRRLERFRDETMPRLAAEGPTEPTTDPLDTAKAALSSELALLGRTYEHVTVDDPEVDYAERALSRVLAKRFGNPVVSMAQEMGRAHRLRIERETEGMSLLEQLEAAEKMIELLGPEAAKKARRLAMLARTKLAEGEDATE